MRGGNGAGAGMANRRPARVNSLQATRSDTCEVPVPRWRSVRKPPARLSFVNPIWIWVQGLIVVFVLAGMVIAIVRLS
jgi:hypothetical protein